jgi:2-keto-4-pentenoate hydratase/2-oxohepta-3-ene-1,7-dioic acid hydratase in catechol pathway
MVEVALADGERIAVGSVYGIGRNYAAHAAELGNAVPEDPVVFLKARTAVRGLASGALAFAESFHHEVEVVLLLGRPVPLGATPGWEAVRAVALGLDLTRREVQNRCKEKGLPWVPAKSFAGSAVIGPFVPLGAVGDPDSITFSLAVNGEVRQRGALPQMVFPVPRLLAYLASLAPLEAGDVVFTGTPSGVGPIRAGDAFVTELTSSRGTWTWNGRL